MAFKNLQAPITNERANKRFQDTQSLRARQLAGQAQGANTAAAAQTGAVLAGQTAEQNIQEQQRTAGLAGQAAQRQIGQQRMQAQGAALNQEQTLANSQRRLDQKLFNLNQNAADEEQRMRNDFTNRTAQNNYLQEIEVQDWLMANAKDEQDFMDKFQELEQAHKRKATLIDNAYKTKIRELQKKATTEDQESAQAFRKEITELQNRWKEDRRKRQAEAANRSAMKSAIGIGVGAVLAGTASFLTVGAATPFAPAIIAGSQAIAQQT